MRRTRGFTLIELMLVVAIIGLLAAIAIPKFANLVTKSKEAAVRGSLGSLRSALALYYADQEGNYPGCLGVAFNTYCLPLALVPRYIASIPTASIPTQGDHVPNAGVRFGEPNGPAGYAVVPEWRAYMGPGGEAVWYYQMVAWFGTWDRERIQVNCSHLDSRGVNWSLS